MKLLLKNAQPQARLDFIRAHLNSAWEIAPCHSDNGTEYASALSEADALVAMSVSSASPPAPRLRLLQLPGAGFDRVDFAAIPKDCTVCNVFEHEIPMAEYLVLGMLEWLIRMGPMSRDMRDGRWTDGATCGEPSHGELFGKTIGFIGYGHIAKAAASRLAPFGVTSIACTRSPAKGGEHLAKIAGMDEVNWLLQESDFVVVTCPLTDSTRGLIGAAELARMKPTAVVINVARAAVVDEAALFAACKVRRIGGAILDVWTNYPDGSAEQTFPSDHAFHTLDNVVMTPHASGWSDGLWDRRWRAMCDNLNRLAAGQELVNILKAPGGKAPA